jgi:hypothetical protein
MQFTNDLQELGDWLKEPSAVTPQQRALMLQLQKTTALHTSSYFTGVTFALDTHKAVFGVHARHEDDIADVFEHYFGDQTPALLERIKFSLV